MRLKQYINEKYNMQGTMIGFEVDKNAFKPIIDEIGTLLKDNNIGYDVIETPHITIAQIVGKYPKDELKRDMDKIRPMSFNPKGLTIFWGFNVKRYFVVAEYKPRKEFIEELRKLSEKYEVRVFPGGVKPHISIASIGGDTDESIIDEIRLKLGKSLPKIKTKGVSLFNNKFEVEYKEKKK